MNAYLIEFDLYTHYDGEHYTDRLTRLVLSDTYENALIKLQSKFENGIIQDPNNLTIE